MIVSYSSCFVFEKKGIIKIVILFICTGTRIRTQIKGFGDPYATVAPCPYKAKSYSVCSGTAFRIICKYNKIYLLAAKSFRFELI